MLAIGESVGVVISRRHLRALGWWKGDTIVQEVQDDQVVLRNLTPHTVKRVHHREEYGNAVTNRTQFPV
jgi:hypothetical protein